MNRSRRIIVLPLLLLTGLAAGVDAEESPVCWGRTALRNNAAPDAGPLPESWNPGKFDARRENRIDGNNTSADLRNAARNIAWSRPLGDPCYGTPVVADGRVFIATNNAAAYLERSPAEKDLGVLLAFDIENGDFLWQYSIEKLDDGTLDWPGQGLCSNPVVEGDRLWIVTNRCEVVCLSTGPETAGQNDGENDAATSGNPDVPRILWRFDMRDRLGVVPHNMTSNSPLVIDDLVVCVTSNGVGRDDKTVVNPKAPSFLALDKETGETVWSDPGPGAAILDGQWGSPAAWKDRLFFPGGDGLLYCYRLLPRAANDGNLANGTHDTPGPRLVRLWTFDCNPAGTVWKGHGNGDKNTLVATPVVAHDRVYIATGQDPESGDGPAVLWCLDVENGKPVWSYAGRDSKSWEFEDGFHRTIGSVVVDADLLLVGDFSGILHCLDAHTGALHWTHDARSAIWGGPLAADGKFYIGTGDGDVLVLKAAPEFRLLATVEMNGAVYGSPVVRDGAIYLAVNKALYKICVRKDKQ